jgi:hypothetical protein
VAVGRGDVNLFMLTLNQKKYIETIPKEKIAVIQPFNPKVKEIAAEIIEKIKNELPTSEIFFLGASALGVAGQNDIDITVVNDDVDVGEKTLQRLFGNFTKKNPGLIKWEFRDVGFEVELYLTRAITPSLQEQIDTSNLLRNNHGLLREYENMKFASNGITFREYMGRKYEFFNRILGIK